jgi:rare lipoprotein A
MIVVRINDRGPYGNDRVISLSRSADRLNTSNNTKVRIDPIIVAPDGSLSGPGMACTTVAKQTYALPARPDLDGGGGCFQRTDAARRRSPDQQFHAEAEDNRRAGEQRRFPRRADALNSGVLEGSEPTPAPQPPVTAPATPTAPAATPAAVAAPAPAASASGVLSFRSAPSAIRRAQQYQQRLSQQFSVPGRVVQNGAVWRIQLGPFASKAQASTVQQRLQSEAQLQSFITHANNKSGIRTVSFCKSH